MPNYYFKAKNSKDKFSARVKASTEGEAIEYFALVVKKLPIKEFTKIYEVKREN